MIVKMAELPEEACVVSVMHMVNPATFWVSEPLGHDMTEERGQLQALEESLQAHCRHVSFYKQGCHMPEQGEMVAVEHPKTHRWHRGRVEGVLNMSSGFVYKVFLVDHGAPLQVRSSSIQELPESCAALDYQAVQVVIYGVVPVTRQLEYEYSTVKTTVLDHWTAAAVRFVRKLLEQCVKAYVVNHKNAEHMIYGDLYLELEDNVISLKKQLCDNEYAIFSEELFEKGCEADATNNKAFVASSSDGCSSHDRSPCRSPRPDIAKAERRNIREYLNEHNERKKMKEIDTMDKIKEWRQYNKLFEHNNEDNNEDEPLGRGTQIRRRPQITPGGMAKNRQDEVHDSTVKQSSEKSLLDMLDMMSGTCEETVPTQTDDISQPPVSSNSRASISCVPAGAAMSSTSKTKTEAKQTDTSQLVLSNSRANVSQANKSISYVPAGAAMSSTSKTKSEAKQTSNNEPAAYNRNTTSFSQKNVNKTEELKLTRNSCKNDGALALPDNSTDDGKAETLNNICSQKSKLRNSSDGSTSTRPMTLFERIQEKVKNTNKNSDGVMQKIMDGVIKSSQSKTQLQPNSTKSSDQGRLPFDYKLMDRSSAARLLVHGDMRSRPIQSIADANFPPEIHQALGKMDFKSPMRIQMYAWPAIMRGQYTILVGPPRSGKTLSYVVPVVSFMLTPDMYSELTPGNGPLVLILCSGSRSAEFIYQTCCCLLQFARQTEIRVQLALGGSCEIDLRDQLANGCDILISTPRCVLRLLRCSHLITNLDRLAHLVVDEVDILADKFLPEVKKILSECKSILKQRTKVAVPIQLIAASEKWCPAVEQFSQHVSQDFVICISRHLEAAVYAKLQPTLHYVNTNNKVNTLLGILDGERGLYKTLVVCKTAEEVDMLEPFLVSQCYNVVTAHEEKTNSRNRDAYQHWKNCIAGAYPVLVCSDDVLPEMDAYDAMCLIHYSLPPTKTKFGFRFSCLMDNYTSVFHKSSRNDDDPDCMVHIFIDKESNSKELPQVVQLMRRLSLPIHPEIEAEAAEFMQQQECQKSSAPLCYNIKAFGKCLEKNSCPYRHIVLSALDEPVNIPRRGVVKLKILHVLDASRFAARLLQYKDVHASDDYFVVNMAVFKYYSNEKNRGLHGVPNVGDICGLEHKVNTFQRVEVVEIICRDEKSVPEEVEVFFLDEGIYKEVKVYQLLSLPEHLRQLPRQTVEVFLCNVMPCDLDTCWSREASYRMCSWIRTISAGETQAKFVAGRIVLSLGNTLWLDPLKCCSHLESVHTFVTEVSLRSELLKSKLAVENLEHITSLLELCAQGQIDVATYSPVEEKQKEELPTPEWAHLSCDDYQVVFFIYANDPHEFFVRRHDADNCFQDLVAEIQEYVKTKPKDDFVVEKGSLCVGKFPDDGIWYRASVNEILEDKLVSLFFVDHGDFASVSIDEIVPITPNLISKLQFQAIECSLAGVRPVDGDIWCEDATDVLYDFTDGRNIIHVKVREVLEQGRCTGGKKYKVFCVDTSTKEDILLNQVLVDRKLAVCDSIDQLMEERILQQDDGSEEESNVELDSCVVKLSDVCKEVKSCDLEHEEDSEDEYDVQISDVDSFVKTMLGLDKLVQRICTPSVGTNKLLALPAPMHRSSSLDSVSSDDEERVPLLASTIKTPQVLWYQDYCTIGIKIELTGVDQYYLAWDVMHFKFSTELNSDIYEVGDELFGPVIPSQLSHSAKGLYVHIKMKKAVSGFIWPRLFNSRNRRMWLKYDLDMLRGDSVQAVDYDKLQRLEQREREESAIVIDTDEEDYGDDDDESDYAYDNLDAPYDPFDPLN